MSEQVGADKPASTDYESIPYDSMPFAQSQPSNLAAIAAFFGYDSPRVDDCRVLDLGCASGGNIIPLAARFPAARFTGIDLSERHVAIGKARIAALALTNIDIRQGDLADPDLIAGEFDYIICHGVYSWVPAAARAGVLNICSRFLAPNGLAYISYNVLPGWQLRKVIRDILLFHCRTAIGPQERVAKAREMLAQLAAIGQESTVYGQLIRSEAKQLATFADSYILGEFLTDENHPCYFSDFVAQAEAVGLAYLADVDLRSSLPETISPEFSELLLTLGGGSHRVAEQYHDFFQGRRFRQSVLIREGRDRRSRSTADARRMADLHFSSQLRIDGEQPRADELRLRDAKGVSVATNDKVVAQALDHLGAIFPETRSLAQLAEPLEVEGEAASADVRERIGLMLQRLIVAGLVFMSSCPVRTGRAGDERPRAWSVAREDHAAGQRWVTNLRHMPVRPGAVASALLPLLDGRHDRRALTERLREMALAGRSSALEASEALVASSSADLEAQVDRVLSELEQLAILE